MLLQKQSVLSAIDEASSLGITHIAFTGGEPLGHCDDICNFVHHAHDRRCVTSIATCARNTKLMDEPEQTVHALRKAGLDRIGISWDRYHAGCDSDWNEIEHIIHLCRASGMHVQINAVIPDRPDMADVRVERRLREFNVPYVKVPLSPFGRGRTMFSEHQLVSKSRSYCDVNCVCDMIGNLTYVSDGTLVPCCGTGMIDAIHVKGAGLANVLNLGNLYRESLSDSLARSEASIFLTIMATLGPMGFFLLDDQHVLRNDDRQWPERGCSVCQFCCFAAGSSDFQAFLGGLSACELELLPRLRRAREVLERWGLIAVPLQVP
jgi:MoaA/NifB/PqqE/SkfB family radical SAM enzyme